MTDLANKNVLITGAAMGIGKLMAGLCAEQGAKLILWDINEEALNKTAEEFRALGTTVYTGTVNVTDRPAIEAAAQNIAAEAGPVDVLINNAGIVTGKSLLEASPAEIQRTFDINTLALFWMTRAFLPSMIERDSGHIVTIASAAGLVGTSKLVDYCSSKFAAVGFDEALRLEMKSKGYKIQTTVVCPYYIDTGMFEGVKTRFSWLLPILKPEYAAKRIVTGIRRNHRRVVMPRFVFLVSPIRVFPVWFFDALMAFFGVSKSMDEFKGHRESGRWR